jgi:hypothetical protein
MERENKMVFWKRKPKVSEFLNAICDGSHVVADCDGGWVTIKKDDETLFEGTMADTTVVFLATVGLIGKKSAKRLIAMEE